MWSTPAGPLTAAHTSKSASGHDWRCSAQRLSWAPHRPRRPSAARTQEATRQSPKETNGRTDGSSSHASTDRSRRVRRCAVWLRHNRSRARVGRGQPPTRQIRSFQFALPDALATNSSNGRPAALNRRSQPEHSCAHDRRMPASQSTRAKPGPA